MLRYLYEFNIYEYKYPSQGKPNPNHIHKKSQALLLLPKNQELQETFNCVEFENAGYLLHFSSQISYELLDIVNSNFNYSLEGVGYPLVSGESHSLVARDREWA